QAKQDVSYRQVGATRSDLPSGYVHDRESADLGPFDSATFDRAGTALNSWRVQAGAGLNVFPGDPVAVGDTLLWSSGCLAASTRSWPEGWSSWKTNPTVAASDTEPCQVTSSKGKKPSRWYGEANACFSRSPRSPARVIRSRASGSLSAGCSSVRPPGVTSPLC